MNAPDKIFMPNELLSEEWGRHIEGQDTEYIRKDALLEWAKEQELDAKFTTTDGIYNSGREDAFHKLIEKLESL